MFFSFFRSPSPGLVSCSPLLWPCTPCIWLGLPCPMNLVRHLFKESLFQNLVSCLYCELCFQLALKLNLKSKVDKTLLFVDLWLHWDRRRAFWDDIHFVGCMQCSQNLGLYCEHVQFNRIGLKWHFPPKIVNATPACSASLVWTAPPPPVRIVSFSGGMPKALWDWFCSWCVSCTPGKIFFHSGRRCTFEHLSRVYHNDF